MIRTLNAKELREEIAELKNKALAIGELAEAEGRDLTPQEQREFDQIVGVGKPGEPRYKAGEIGELEEQLDRAEQKEKLQAGILADRIRTGQIRFGDGSTGGGRGPQWKQNADGQRYAILNKGDRFTDLVSSPCENAFGHAVLAYAFGPSRETPEPIRNALKEGTGSAGGYTVAGELLGEVIDLARAKSVLMDAGTRTVAMTTDSMSVPALESDVSVELKGENQSATFSDVTIGQRKLSTRTAMAITAVSRELWEDSPGLLAEQLQRWMGAKMAQQIDSIGLNGYTSKPAGLLGTTGINSTGSIGAIDWADVAAAVSRIRVNNHEPNAIIMHPTIHDDLFNIETGDGTNAARGWLDAPPTIRDKQFLMTTNCPLANLVTGDFSRFMMGVRTGILIETSTEAGSSFEKHQVYVKATARFDFVSVDDSAFEILAGITS